MRKSKNRDLADTLMFIKVECENVSVCFFVVFIDWCLIVTIISFNHSKFCSRTLLLTGNYFKQPRHTTLEKGTEAVLSYLRDRIPTS